MVTDIPGLSDFKKIPGLKPILVYDDEVERNMDYLLTCGRGYFYMWNDQYGDLRRFVNQTLTLKDVVDMIQYNEWSEYYLVPEEGGNGSPLRRPGAILERKGNSDGAEKMVQETKHHASGTPKK